MIAQVPDATRLLGRLGAMGLIMRARDSKDRRLVTTRVTNEDRQLLATMDEPVDALHRNYLAGLSEEDQRTLIALLSRVRNGI